MTTLLVATHNRWKAKLFASIFNGYGFKALSLLDIETNQPPPDECGRSEVENALIKARHYHSAQFPWVFGDDTGLEIDALMNKPSLSSPKIAVANDSAVPSTTM